MKLTLRPTRQWAAFALLLMLVGVLLSTGSLVFAAANDNNVQWAELGHNSRDLTYRTPFGAVVTGSEVRLRFRAAVNDLTGVQIRLWNDRLNQQTFVNMTRVAADDTYEWWEYVLNVGAEPNAYYYRFIAKDGTSTAYYQDSDNYGGWGAAAGSADDFQSWQVTVYDPTFTTPDWVQNAVIYQIFADRFRDGDNTNNTPAGTFFYDEAGGTIYRSQTTDWNTIVCDPREDSNDGCEASYSRNFYGGDLEGVLDQLDYLEDLGVTAIYFNPIFESPSNHKYDTTDFGVIDDNFGDLTLFQTLAAEAESRGMNLILDGVFNHSSSDSHYFDRYERYADFIGACEATDSVYRDWYYFTDNPAGPCAGPANYESWFGFDSLPKMQANSAGVRALIWSDGVDSIAPYWMQWASGWRLDVGGDVDPGTASDPANDYWEGFRDAIHAVNPDAYIVGEEWGNATSWLLGQEWDATMNYQYSSIMLSFWRDTAFVDNDHNSGSSAGPLNPISPTTANERLLNWKERYPAEAYEAMMNLLGSHDTSRALFMLDHGHPASPAEGTLYPNDPNHDWSGAINRLMGVVLMQMTLPGAPTIYYGDEIGLVGPQRWAGGKWEDDPYNRQPYPWLDETGTPFYTFLQSAGAGSARAELLAYYSTLTAAHNTHAALRVGSFDPLFTQDFPADPIYVYGRKLADNSDAAVVFINRSNTTQDITVNVSGYLPIGATFDNVLTVAVESYTVAANGDLLVSDVVEQGGALLVLTGGSATPPLNVLDLAAVAGSNQVTLTWGDVASADSYDVYRSLLTGGGYELLGNTLVSDYVDTTVTNGTTYYYMVVSRDAATGLESGYSNEASAIPSYDLDAAVLILQSPFIINHTISTTTPTPNVYGQIYIAGVTDAQNTPVAGIRAQLGFGPDSSTPDDDWTWSEMIPNAGFDFSASNDEYLGTMLPDAVGDYDYTIRFSSDNGLTWFLAETRDGGGSPIGDMTVVNSDDTNAPSAPSSLAVTGTTSASISLAWEASVDTRVSRALDSYNIYRAVSPGVDFVLIDSVAAGTLTYTDLTVTAEETYDYYVTALDDSFNESAPSNTVTGTAEDVLVEVHFITTVSPGTPDETIYIVGNQSVWGPWNPGLVAMTETSPGVWEWTGEFLTGTAVEYKHTRGNWDKVEKQADGFGEISHQFTVSDEGGGQQTREVTVLNWRDPHVIATFPADGETDANDSTVIQATFNKAIDFAAGTFGTKFVVTGPDSLPVSGTFSYDETTHVVTFTPDALLAYGLYTVDITNVSAASGGDKQQVQIGFSFTVNGTGTEVPTAVPTIAPTEVPGTELLANGGFEAQTGDNKPDLTPWTLKNPTKDKIKCNTETKTVAYTGECAFMFKGSTGEIASLQQVPDLTTVTPAAGDTLDFSAFLKATNAAAAGKVKVIVQYSDAAAGKLNLTIATNTDYTELTGSLMLASANVTKVKVQVKHRSTAGKVYLDAVSLLHTPGGAAGLGSRSIPLP